MSTGRNDEVDSLVRQSFNRSHRAFALFMLSSGRRGLICICLLLLLGSCVATAQDKKMEMPELISRHQQAVGSAAARGAIKSRFAAGTAKYVSRMGSSPNVEGTVGLVSLNPKLRYSIKFPSQQYPGEQLAFDGKHLDVGVLQGGRRTALGLVALPGGTRIARRARLLVGTDFGRRHRSAHPARLRRRAVGAGSRGTRRCAGRRSRGGTGSCRRRGSAGRPRRLVGRGVRLSVAGSGEGAQRGNEQSLH